MVDRPAAGACLRAAYDPAEPNRKPIRKSRNLKAAFRRLDCEADELKEVVKERCPFQGAVGDVVMQRGFDCLSEWIEWALSTWWGVSLYVAACVAVYIAGSWDGVDRWTFITGTFILVLLIGSGRRDSKATHAKLDDIDDRDDLNRIEELTEKEIEERRR